MSAPAEGSPADDPLVRMAAVGLAAGRLAIGAGLWLAPVPVARALGFGRLDERALAIGRIAATRDLVLGAWQLRSLGDATELGRSSTAIAVVDAGDALTFALALRGADGARRAGGRGLLGAVPASLAGFWLARRLRGSESK